VGVPVVVGTTVRFRVGLTNSMSRPSIVGTPAMGLILVGALGSLLVGSVDSGSPWPSLSILIPLSLW
jgi:hypothetical protein